MIPDFVVSNDIRAADIYDRHTHFTIEQYQNGLWQSVKIARTLDEAKMLAENYVNEIQKPTLLNERT